MANRAGKPKQTSLWSELSTPLLILAAFGLGAGGMWVIMRPSASTAPPKPLVQSFNPPPSLQPPDVSQLGPAEAAQTLANWNYDRQNWAQAIEHYQAAIARGADNADVRTDLGNCFRFLGQPQKALEQYELAQKENPLHENSLFNQAGLFAEVLHDDQRALVVAREFMTRFPQSPRTESARQLVTKIQERTRIDR